MNLENNADFTTSLKTEICYVIVDRWPLDGVDWIHPEDQAKVTGLIPSKLIFKRELQSDGYYRLTHGKDILRVQPVMMKEVAQPKFEMGDQVRIKSNLDQHKPNWGTIFRICYREYFEEAEYYLIRGDLKSQLPFRAHQLESFEAEEREYLINQMHREEIELPTISINETDLSKKNNKV